VVVESTACLTLDHEAMLGTNQAVRHRKLIDRSLGGWRDRREKKLVMNMLYIPFLSLNLDFDDIS
jgi:hypothetical protein